jgi:hypothetical protein
MKRERRKRRGEREGRREKREKNERMRNGRPLVTRLKKRRWDVLDTIGRKVLTRPLSLLRRPVLKYMLREHGRKFLKVRSSLLHQRRSEDLEDVGALRETKDVGRRIDPDEGLQVGGEEGGVGKSGGGEVTGEGGLFRGSGGRVKVGLEREKLRCTLRPALYEKKEEEEER